MGKIGRNFEARKEENCSKKKNDCKYQSRKQRKGSSCQGNQRKQRS